MFTGVYEAETGNTYLERPTESTIREIRQPAGGVRRPGESRYKGIDLSTTCGNNNVLVHMIWNIESL